MRHVVFKTPGLIDIRSFTVMGLSSKPNSDSPIGKFGTGLKMAIAVLVRNDIKVVLWIGRTKYTFKKAKVKFRGAEYQQIIMIREVHGVRKILSKTEIALPFTTELGKYWELWQAYRELESNTRDENGTTYLLDDAKDGGAFTIQAEETNILVSGEKFVAEYLDREKTFLPDGLTQREESTDAIQILERPSQHVYWRGIRVHDLPEDTPAQLTYNFLKDIELTEDRTAKNVWALEYDIKNTLIRSEDEGVIRKALGAPKDTYEGRMAFSYMGSTPTPTFSRMALNSAHPSARKFAEERLPKEPKVDPWHKFPRPWTIEDYVNVLDANGKKVCQAESAMIATAILSKINETEEVMF